MKKYKSLKKKGSKSSSIMVLDQNFKHIAAERVTSVFCSWQRQCYRTGLSERI